MLFLVVLAIATAGAAVVLRGRSDRRSVARLGLGIALAVAGLSHFVNPTPFEQHLPSWVPASDLVVAISGVAEVALGIALLAAWPSATTIGWTVAAFLVAVLPANVYVAVADVDVDGQPGGPYPWIRLPLQFLFIAWVLWSTRPADVDDELPTGGVMPPVPWIDGPAADSANASGAETIVMASVLELRRRRDVPGFLVAALRLRRLFAGSPGAIRLSLTAIPLRTTFWTLSQWQSRAEMEAYVRHPTHVEVMRKYSSRMDGSTFATWTELGSVVPSWDRAHAEIASTRGRSISDRSGRRPAPGAPHLDTNGDSRCRRDQASRHRAA
ncbi:MAG: hypothetical protein AAFZ07_11100 [Actinomycetota bacterium]